MAGFLIRELVLSDARKDTKSPQNVHMVRWQVGLGRVDTTMLKHQNYSPGEKEA